jgi:hypothetical protein
MRVFLHTLLGKVLTTSTVVAACGVGAFVAVNAAAAPAGKPLDHFACYSGEATSAARHGRAFRAAPAVVSVNNQFGTRRALAGSFAAQCNPAKLTLSGPSNTSFGVNDPSDHLTCFDAHQFHGRDRSTVDVTGAFNLGTGNGRAVKLSVGRLEGLCVPALTAANAAPSGTPSGIDAFACYDARYRSGSARPAVPSSLRLTDEFTDPGRSLAPGVSLASLHPRQVSLGDLAAFCVASKLLDHNGTHRADGE